MREPKWKVGTVPNKKWRKWCRKHLAAGGHPTPAAACAQVVAVARAVVKRKRK